MNFTAAEQFTAQNNDKIQSCESVPSNCFRFTTSTQISAFSA